MSTNPHGDHDHSHVTDASHNYSEANRTHFDKEAASSNDDPPYAVEAVNRIGSVILQVYPFDENKTTVLDYACARGSASRRLLPHVKSIVGVDISQGMVDVYNQHAYNQGLAPDEMKAVCAELKGVDGELDGQKFDVVVCSLAYHHFSDINQVTVLLTHFLKPGGMLIVADFRAGSESPDDEEMLVEQKYHHIVPHHDGMSVAVVKTAFENAGLDNFEVKDVGPAKFLRREIILYVATGVKKPEKV